MRQFEPQSASDEGPSVTEDGSAALEKGTSGLKEGPSITEEGLFVLEDGTSVLEVGTCALEVGTCAVEVGTSGLEDGTGDTNFTNLREFGGRKGKVSKETRKGGVQEKANSPPGFLVSWVPHENPPARNAKSQEVRKGTTPGVWDAVTTIFTGARAMVMKGLTPGTNYTFSFRSIGGSTGQSDWSDPVSHMAT